MKSQEDLSGMVQFLFWRPQTEKVMIQGRLSFSQPITAGVPQGSFLGSLWFNYTFWDDLPFWVFMQHLVITYADEQHKFHSYVDALYCWKGRDYRLGVNKKVLNHSCHWKTNSVEFAASRDFGLELNCKNLTTQDRQLFKLRQTWHVLKKKTVQRRYLLQRANKFFSLKVRTLFYNSLIQPILDYWAVDKQATWTRRYQITEIMCRRNPGRKIGHSNETFIYKTYYLAI